MNINITMLLFILKLSIFTLKMLLFILKMQIMYIFKNFQKKLPSAKGKFSLRVYQPRQTYAKKDYQHCHVASPSHYVDTPSHFVDTPSHFVDSPSQNAKNAHFKKFHKKLYDCFYICGANKLRYTTSSNSWNTLKMTSIWLPVASR